MPFSAATGVTEAALAAETIASDQTQPASMQAAVNVPKMMSTSPGRIFNSRLETAKDMKLLSRFQGRPVARETPLKSNQLR
jgi:hypothetical protein